MKKRQFLNKLDVCNKLKCSKATIYNYVQDGLLSPAITMYGKSKWYEHEIDEIMRLLAAECSEEKIREVVRRQIADREYEAMMN